MRTLHTIKVFSFMLLALTLALPQQALANTPVENEKESEEKEEVSVRAKDPWTITVGSNILLSGYRISNRFNDGKMEAALFLGAAMTDFKLCILSPCEDDSNEAGPALGIGFRRYFTPSRFTGYVGTNFYALPHGIEIAEKAFLLPSVTAGIYWQAYSGFTFAIGAEVYIFPKSQSHSKNTPSMGSLATVPWFTMEFGWSF